MVESVTNREGEICLYKAAFRFAGIFVTRRASELKSGRCVMFPISWSALSPRKLRAVRDYVEANIGGALNLDDLASVVHVSSFHFAGLFKSATGETPHDFVTRVRIEKAKSLLRDTDWPASKIAKHVGLSNKSHFSAALRRFVGLTPIGFRNVYR
jgi:AraC-like DNA-binding protein